MAGGSSPSPAWRPAPTEAPRDGDGRRGGRGPGGDPAFGGPGQPHPHDTFGDWPGTGGLGGGCADDPGRGQGGRLDSRWGGTCVQRHGGRRDGNSCGGRAIVHLLPAQANNFDSAPSTNVVASPYSLAEALLMLELGAKGITASQIGSALGMEGMSPDQQAGAWASLSADLQNGAGADRVALQDADSLWVQPSLSLVPSYLASLKQTFDAGIWKTDFNGHPAASVAAINEWVSQQTHGKITKLLSTGDIDPDTVLALLNAVYFKAPWQTQLSDQPRAVFHAPGGDVTVPYLGNGGFGTVKASVGDGVEEVELPYWNGVPATDQQSRNAGGAGRYAADIIMPTSESLPRFIEGLDAGSWRGLVGRLSSQAVDLTFPKFSLAGNTDLSQTLQALGITEAFSSQSADLSGISPTPTYVKLVRQAATLDVTKWGTVATAATAVVAEATAAERTVAVHIDRPFLFVIRDTKTGAILFTATVSNPSS